LSASKANLSGLAVPYATALFELAEEEGVLEEVAGDLAGLDELLAGSADLDRLIRSPVISRQDQRRAVDAVAERAGFHALTRRFLGLLAEKRRLFALRGMIRAYREMLAEHKGEVAAEVASAVPLDDEQMAGLDEVVGRFAGRKVRLDRRVDPELLGGLVVRVGSRMLDASLKTKLQHLEMSMRGMA